MAISSKKSEKKEEIKATGELKDAGSYAVLIEPWVTEKSHQQTVENKYIFKTNKNSGKLAVKRAVEDLYKVSVTNVRVINIPAKRRMAGRKTGWKSGFKKAIVRLRDGDKIELFKGV